MNTPQSWPRFRFNAAATGGYGPTEIQQPQQLSQHDTGDIIESSPVIVNDTLFIGGHSKELRALDLKLGQSKWNFKTDGWISATPSVANGSVFFGSDDQHVYALNALVSFDK